MSQRPLAIAFAAALVAGIAVAWTPRFWHVSVQIACVSAVALIWLARRNRDIELPPHTILVALIGGWGFLQLAFHSSVAPKWTLRSSIVWAICGVSFVAGSQILKDRRAREAFLKFMLWSVTALAVSAMLQIYNTPVKALWIFPAEGSVVGTFLYRNQFAALMELVAPIALWRVAKGELVFGGLCFAAMFAATAASASRTGTILMVVELLGFLFFTAFIRRQAASAAATIIVALAVLVTGALLIAGTDRIWGHFHDQNVYGARRPLLASTEKMVAERPWFGFGMGTWRAEYPRFATFDQAVIANEAHNDWLQWAAEGGIIFALLMAGLTVWLTKPALESIWGSGILAVMAHSYVDYVLREPGVALVWFAIAGAVVQAHHPVKIPAHPGFSAGPGFKQPEQNL